MAQRRILVTGAGGFIGSHVVEACLQRGHAVTAFVHYNSRNDRGWIDGLEGVDIVAGDIRDFDAVSSAMQGATDVLHLAALIGIPYSYVSPLAYIRTNIEGTYNVVESGRRLGISNIVVTSTSETYGSAQFVPISENHPAVGQSPYSATKIAADEIALSYWRSFNTPVKVARPFNTYGPRQSARAIIPTIISQILGGMRRLKLGSLTPTRDLTYVADTAAGFLSILESSSLFGQATNIGMGREISIGDLVALIAEIMEVEVEIISDDQRIRPEKSEVTRLMCDPSKLLAETNWKPEFTLRSGLAATVDWMRSNTEFFKPEEYNV